MTDTSTNEHGPDHGPGDHGHGEHGEEPNYLQATKGLKSWLLTVDHKRLGLMYLCAVFFFFFVGGVAALLVRTELFTNTKTIVDADTYNKFFTVHGAVMVFLVIIPSVPAALGNFALPLQLGAKDVAFPKLNLLSFWVYCTGAIMAVSAIFFGGVDTGWTFYTPYSSTTDGSVIMMVAAVFVLGFSSIFTGMNFIVTIHKMRPAGHDLVPSAPLPLGHLRHLHHPGDGDAGAGHHAAAPHHGARDPGGHL